MVSNFLMSSYSLYDNPRKRIPVRGGLKKWILNDVQKGKCKRCGESIKKKGVTPILHHKNLNPKDNRPENLIVICPDCHDKIHQREKKVVKTTTNYLGFTERRVKIIRKGVKKKRTKRKTIRRRTTYNPLSIGIPRLRILEPFSRSV